MLLTCTVRSIASLLKPRGKAGPKLALTEVPSYIKNEIGLNGMNFSTELLAGASREDLAAIRDRADKAGCACLLLVEPSPQAMASPTKAEAAIDRARRVVQAAHVLGCNAASISVEAPATDTAFDRVVESMRRVMDLAEQLEIYTLIQPRDGLTADPERVTELIKKIGGFRVGTLPDFAAAAAAVDPEFYLRRLTPYASAVLASTYEFAEPDEADPDAPGSLEDLADLLMGGAPAVHATYDLAPMLKAIASVGFEGTLAIDYRGEGDGTLGVMQSRDAIEACLEALAE